VQSAFRTEIHQYRVNGQLHFANVGEPSIPAALEPVILGLHGLDDFSLKAPGSGRLLPDFTSAGGNHTLTPDDLATIYNISSLYNSGVDGSGQALAIAGQSGISLTDIRLFRSKYNLPPKDPQLVLVGQNPGRTGDEFELEADLDLEWAGAVARNANIVYIYARSVLTAVQYAIDQNLAPVLSLSFGICEQQQGGTTPLVFRSVAQQGNAQGITWLTASGDAGAATCDRGEPLATNGLAVSFPSSIPEVTSVGGTQFDDGAGNYWNSNNNANGGSALSYIPEVAWNETGARNSPTSTGGGASILYTKPDWQAGPGVPNDHARDVPDISLTAASHDGYSICSLGSCGFTVYGTSASTPSFAGMVALLNQYLVSNGIQVQAGVGNINPELYRLAQSSPNTFHDIVSGDNIVPCASGTPQCVNGSLGYSATSGYDLATGLGSVDAFSLVTGWNTASTVITVTANPGNISLSGFTQLTVTVTAKGGTGTPAGNVTLTLGTQFLASSALSGSGGVATANLFVYGGQLVVGANTIGATYGGSGVFDGSSVSVVVNAVLPASNSAVVPSVSPNPVYEHQPDAQGYAWSYTLTLTEKAGIGTTLTGLTIDGVNYDSQIVSFFGSATVAPAGRLSASLAAKSLTVPATRIVRITGRDAGGFQWVQEIPVNFLGPGPPFSSFIVGIRNVASGQIAAAPGMLMSVYGQNLGPANGVLATVIPLPPSLAGVSVMINGVSAPLWYVSSSLINLQIPYETARGTAVVTVNNNGQISSYSFVVAAAAPGIWVDPFTNLMTPFPTASPGQEIVLFITGDGQVAPPLATGNTPPPDTPVSQLPASTLALGLTVGGLPANIVFHGIPYGNVGVTQVNFKVPNVLPGLQPVIATVGNVRSLTATLLVTSGSSGTAVITGAAATEADR
jgi:uncharacterized protein (TIGR03437 family)